MIPQSAAIRVLIALVVCLPALYLFVWLALARPFAFARHNKRPPSVFADPNLLQTHVKKLAEELSPRDWTNRENLNRCAAYISSQFRKGSGRVTFQDFEVRGGVYTNVISEYGPPEADIMIAGAHYDAFGPFPGADDNASGIAGLLELGRLLSRDPPSSRVILVAYSLEEPPFFTYPQMGSSVHAASLLPVREKVRLMISLEMIGYFSDLPGSQAYPSKLLRPFYGGVGNFIAVVGSVSPGSPTVAVKRAMIEAEDLPVHSINAPSVLPGIDFSDHRSYWEQGFQAVMITDTAFYRNSEYHEATDTPERLDYERMAKVVNGLYSFLTERR